MSKEFNNVKRRSIEVYKNMLVLALCTKKLHNFAVHNLALWALLLSCFCDGDVLIIDIFNFPFV